MAKEYICECGKHFNNSQSFNGHKSHCKVHQLEKYGSLDKLNERLSLYNFQLTVNNETKHKKVLETKQAELESWISEQHICEHCGKVMTERYGSGRFCCRACANSRKCSTEKREQLSKALKGKGKVKSNFDVNLAIIAYEAAPNFCINCGAKLPYEKRYRKSCSDKCLHELFQKAGLAAANSQQTRSKNEIAFCELCENYFKNVKHNEPIFNGWDADIIIEDYKLAILWNGPWHYIQIGHKQSLKQVQNRDIIKIKEIEKCGYIPYIIKDVGKHKAEFITEQFNILLEYLNNIK